MALANRLLRVNSWLVRRFSRVTPLRVIKTARRMYPELRRPLRVLRTERDVIAAVRYYPRRRRGSPIQLLVPPRSFRNLPAAPLLGHELGHVVSAGRGKIGRGVRRNQRQLRKLSRRMKAITWERLRSRQRRKYERYLFTNALGSRRAQYAEEVRAHKIGKEIYRQAGGGRLAYWMTQWPALATYR